MSKKICSKCKIEKDEAEFYKDKSKRDGLRHLCKLCEKKYRQNNRVRIYEYQSKYYNSYAKKPSYRYYVYKRNALRRNLPFDLTLEQFKFIISKPCMFCNSTENIGLDRMVNDKGYSKDNCISCCTSCNYAKRTMTTLEYLRHCQRVVDRFNHFNS